MSFNLTKADINGQKKLFSSVFPPAFSQLIAKKKFPLQIPSKNTLRAGNSRPYLRGYIVLKLMKLVSRRLRLCCPSLVFAVISANRFNDGPKKEIRLSLTTQTSKFFPFRASVPDEAVKKILLDNLLPVTIREVAEDVRVSCHAVVSNVLGVKNLF